MPKSGQLSLRSFFKIRSESKKPDDEGNPGNEEAVPARLTEPASQCFVPVEQLSAPSSLCNPSTVPSSSSETPAASPSCIGLPAPRINPLLNKRRKFNEAWKRDFPWVEFDAAKQVVYCGPCKWAVDFNKITTATRRELTSKPRSAWATEGFTNFRSGTSSFAKHAASSAHRECVVAKLRASDNTVADALDFNFTKNKNRNREALDAIFDGVLYLTRQGLALRGDKDEDSNLITFLQSVAKYSPPVDRWLKRDGQYRWLSHPVQNGMLRVLSHAVIRQIVQDVALSKYFSVVADETTDISTKQQLSLCVRFVNGKLEPQEMFLGLVDMPKADASTIVQAIKSAVTACGLNLVNCRGKSSKQKTFRNGRVFLILASRRSVGFTETFLQSCRMPMLFFCPGKQQLQTFYR